MESYKHLGLLSITIHWAGLLFLIRTWRGDKSKSFSQHAAPHRKAQIFYLLLFLVALPIFYLFTIRWFVPTLDPPDLYTYLIVAGIVCQIVASIFPDTGGLNTRIHNFGAYGMANLLIPLTTLILFSSASSVAKIIAATSVIYMLIVWSMHFIGNLVWRNYLPFQATYVALFHLTILASTYIQ